MAGALEQSANKATVNSVGGSGSKAITGTSAVTPPSGFYFFAIQVLSDAVVSAQTDGITNQADLSAYTSIGAGSIVYGNWSSITLTSGEAIGYLART